MKYKELYSKERAENTRLRADLDRTREFRDNYVSFIRETGLEGAFMRWTAERLGIKDVLYDDLSTRQSP